MKTINSASKGTIVLNNNIVFYKIIMFIFHMFTQTLPVFLTFSILYNIIFTIYYIEDAKQE